MAIGPAVGGVIDTGQYLIGVYDVLGFEHIRAYGISKGLRLFGLAGAGWLLGLAVLAAPAWAILHKRRITSWFAFLLLGAGVPFVLLFALSTHLGLSRAGQTPHLNAWEDGGPTFIDNQITPHGWWVGLTTALSFGAEGAVVGLAVWSVAYQSTRKSC